MLFRGSGYPIDMEVKEIFDCTDKLSKESGSRFRAIHSNFNYLKKPRILKPLYLMLTYMVLQSMSGLETVSYYCIMLFRER